MTQARDDLFIQPGQTLVTLFQQRVAASPEATALHFRPGDRRRSLTWNQLEQLVRRVAGNLVRAGARPGDRVAQIAENRHEWIVNDLAILAAGAVHVPLHVTLSGPQMAEQLADCGAKLAILSSSAQVEQLRAVAERLPEELRWFVLDGAGPEADLPDRWRAPDARRVLDDRRALGDWSTLSDAGGAEEPLPPVTAPEAPATILYTSGTTGDPKGVVLSHRNLVFNAVATESINREGPGDLRLNFLPLSHIFARTCDVYTWLAGRSQLALARSRETIFEDLATWRPTLLNGVPFFFDYVVRELQQRGEAGQPGALRRLLGGRPEVCCCGGAALPDDLYDFYLAEGIPLLQGYGLTETSPVVSLSSRDVYRRGSVGRPLPGTEIRLAADGEILTRGPHVMSGYYRRLEATEEMVRDGWLHTGDRGRWDDDGYLYITGRKRDLIITTGGKMVAPELLEQRLVRDPLVAQACVIGEGRDYLVALIVPDFEQLAARMGASDDSAGTASGESPPLDDPRVRQLYERCLEERLSDLSRHEQIGRFALLAEPFSIERGELTGKRSLRRAVIGERYAALIEALYGQARARSRSGIARHEEVR